MTQIKRSADCGNSPKNARSEAIAVAIECRDVEHLSGYLSAQASRHWADITLTGLADVLSDLQQRPLPDRLMIDRVVSHGKVGAVNGVADYGTERRRFCHLIEFTSVKCEQVRRIESYD